MAAWKFTDDYGAQYPALTGSILSELVFSAHALNDTDFTGTLDVNATGPALRRSVSFWTRRRSTR